MSQAIDEILEHHGIKGMRWGVRKAETGGSGSSKAPKEVKVIAKHDPSGRLHVVTKGGSHHPAHQDAVLAKVAQQKVKRSGMDSLSNAELQRMVTRMNLETQAKGLRSKQRSGSTSKFVTDTLQNIAKQQVSNLASEAATKQMKKYMQTT